MEFIHVKLPGQALPRRCRLVAKWAEGAKDWLIVRVEADEDGVDSFAGRSFLCLRRGYNMPAIAVTEVRMMDGAASTANDQESITQMRDKVAIPKVGDVLELEITHRIPATFTKVGLDGQVLAAIEAQEFECVPEDVEENQWLGQSVKITGEDW